jgi:Leucine-rich repeat (LRR) protein
MGFWENVPDGPLGATFGERKEDLSKLELDCLKSLKRLDLTISLGAPRSINAVLPELGLERLQTSNEVNSGDLRSLTRCRNLRCLILWQPELSDGDYATFQEFPRLEMLELSSMKLTSRGIEDIASVKSLRCLSLYSGKFRTMDLAPLARLAALDELRLMWAHFFAPSATEPLGQLKKVKVLNLSHSNLDDAGLLPLLDLSELEFLDVGDTQITDEGLMRLAMIKSLKDLRLSYFGNVTKEGRERFSKLRPDVKVDN